MLRREGCWDNSISAATKQCHTPSVNVLKPRKRRVLSYAVEDQQEENPSFTPQYLSCHTAILFNKKKKTYKYFIVCLRSHSLDNYAIILIFTHISRVTFFLFYYLLINIFFLNLIFLSPEHQYIHRLLTSLF